MSAGNPQAASVSPAQDAEESAIVPFPAHDASPSGRTIPVTPPDFRLSSPFSPAEMRRLRCRAGEFVRSLGVRASVYLRQDFVTPRHDLQVRTFRKLCEGFKPQTHIVQFSIPGVQGTGYLEIPLPLASAIVQLQLGSPAVRQDAASELNEIETLVLNHFIQSILVEWSAAVPMLEGAKPNIIGHESTAAFLEHPRENSFVVVSVQTQLAGLTEVFQLAVSCAALEPFIRQKESSVTTRNTDGPRHFTPNEWNNELNDVEVTATAHWRGIKVTTRTLVELKAGDVIPLEPALCGTVELRLAGLPKYFGRLGANGTKRAIEILKTFTR